MIKAWEQAAFDQRNASAYAEFERANHRLCRCGHYIESMHPMGEDCHARGCDCKMPKLA